MGEVSNCTISMARSINRLFASGVFRNHRVSNGVFRNCRVAARHKTAYFSVTTFLLKKFLKILGKVAADPSVGESLSQLSD